MNILYILDSGQKRRFKLDSIGICRCTCIRSRAIRGLGMSPSLEGHIKNILVQVILWFLYLTPLGSLSDPKVV